MFGDVLRKQRIGAGLTQDELADRAGLTAKAVSLIERGLRRRPYPATVSALAEALAPGSVLAEFRESGARPADRNATARPGTRETVPSALPMFGTSYIPRPTHERELTALLEEQSLVTIVGAGGTGKTRLAAFIAGELRSSRAEPVLFVDCTTHRNDAESANELRETLLRMVNAYDRETRSRVFLILDGCERDVATASRIIEAARKLSPAIRVLATSRQRLRLSGETLFPLSGFAVPDAVQLFHERALTRDYGFELSARERDVVAEIARRLEGIPLAVELAAARIDTLSVVEIRDELFSNEAILATPDRNVPLRQQSLSASIDWSLGALEPDEAQLLHRLTAFRGDFTFDAVDAVASAPQSENSPLALLGALIDMLVRRPSGTGSPIRRARSSATSAWMPERVRHRPARTRRGLDNLPTRQTRRIYGCRTELG
jgi:DNA-binding XRE family transcriptional regulator